ncbi:tetratricopeptide repeat protein [Paenibacillus flagellatus]|uniref:Uncharacterized protein n=1 Tax=Paenibacillus flagellatus TaxID=2211139 RepID=A0A2V5K7U1_9BACL|nr:tetratricopeptide repeat protein [Paenibacillus flagellatus]PYI54892.1 hypothetical protein DLM86_10095 [Paenibacillus flagellatus]
MDGEYEIKKAYASILDSDFERAIDWFEQAVQLDPDNADYHYKLSITYARSNRLGKAIEHARRALRLRPDDETYRFHVDTLESKRLVQEAEKHLDGTERAHLSVALLKDAIALDPLSSEAYLLLAAAYGELREYGPAVQAAKEALKLDPNSPEASRMADEYRLKWKAYLQP